MLWATKQLISLNLSTLHNATAHYRPIRHYNALLTEVYWCKSTRKRYPGAKKQEVKLDENLSKVQTLWQFNQFTKSLWGRLSKLLCDSDNMVLIFFFFILSLSSGWGFFWWYYGDPFYSIRPHTLFPVMSLITPSVWDSATWRAASSNSSFILSADHHTRSFRQAHRKSPITATNHPTPSLTHTQIDALMDTHTHTFLTPQTWPNVPSCRPADSHQDTLISLFSSGLLIPLLPYAAYMDYHMLLNSVWIKPEVITLNT